MNIKPKSVTMENTTICGANCIMCPREKFSNKLEHMSNEKFEHYIKQCAENGILTMDFGGYGDPLADPNLEDKLKFVKDNFPYIKIYINSTCQLLDEKKMQFICKYVDTLKISNYGFYKDSYESVHRGSLVFEKVQENIKRLVTLEKKHRPYIIMSFLLLDENKNDLKEWKMYWENKVDEISIWKPHNWSGDYNIENGGNGIEKSCGRPFSGDYVIRANGLVSVCCFDYNRKLIIGDLNKNSFKEILVSEQLEEIINVHLNKSFKTSDIICKECDQICDRSDALIYSSNSNVKVGLKTGHPDLTIDFNEKF